MTDQEPKQIEVKYSNKLTCGHCGVSAPMRIMCLASNIEIFTDEFDPQIAAAGMHYELLLCVSCEDVTLRSTYSDSVCPGGYPWEYVYPKVDIELAGIPHDVACAYEAARRVRRVDANAYGVLLGRVLEMVCADRGATGDTLHKQIQNLQSKGEIPERVVSVATALKSLRNVGAHYSAGELDNRHLPILDALVKSVLEYVYTAPQLVRQAEDAMKEVCHPAAESTGSDNEGTED